MTRAGDATRELLIRTGERLFARHGIDRVPLRELNREAGQRNSSALHYHFGSRDGLLAAIREAHLSVVEEHRRELLDAGMPDGETPVRHLVNALAAPLFRELGNPSGRDFLRIIPMLMERPGHDLRSLTTTPEQTTRVLDLLREQLDHLPAGVVEQRLVDTLRFMATAMADRARELDSGVSPTLEDTTFQDNLVSVLAAGLEAPLGSR